MVIKNTSRAGRKLIAFVYGGSECKAAFAAALQRRKQNDLLILVHCIQATHTDQPAISKAQSILDKFVEEASKKEGRVESRVLAAEKEDLREVAANFANTSGAEIVFVGTRGIDHELLLSSFSHYLVQHVRCDVMVIRDPTMSLSHIY